jgi:Tol biopolymer transport system component
MCGAHRNALRSAAVGTSCGNARRGAGTATGALLDRPGRSLAVGFALLVVVPIVACTGAATRGPSESALASDVPSPPAETAQSTLPEPQADPPCSFGVPMNLGSDINSPGFDGGPTSSFDGLRLYFVSDRPGSQGGDIWVTERPAVDAPFAMPENLGPGVNGPANEGAPSLSGDELVIVFDRDDGGIWTATRAAIDSAFGTAERLGESVNAPFAGFPALSADGLTLYFASERPGGHGGMDLWLATRGGAVEPFGDAENLGPSINGPTNDAMATISADALTITFASTREGGIGDWDLWMANRPNVEAAFGSVANLGPDVNTEGFEGRPHLTSDGSVLFFMSDRPGGQGAVDLWQVSIDCSAD